VKPKLSLAFHSVSEAAARDFAGTVGRVADMGYLGVELGRLPAGVDDQEAARIVAEVGLEVVTLGRGPELAFGSSRRPVVEAMAAYGCKRLVFGSTSFLARGPFKRMSQIVTTCGVVNETLYTAQEEGFTAGIHNHEREFESFEGRPVMDIMLEHLDPGVFLLVDTYWMRTAGADPAAFLERMGARVPVIHVKDGPCRRGEPNTAVGRGGMDWPRILGAATGAQWFSVEIEGLDAEDVLRAASESAEYLTSEGFAEGRS